MPLDIIGEFAASGSSGASARNAARVSNPSSSTAAVEAAAPPVRDEKPAQEEVAVSSPNANVAVYVSPFIRIDLTSRLAIVEIRNSETGEVQQQYPSPRAVREYAQNLPQDSDLRAQGTDDSSQSPRIIGSADDNSSSAPLPPGLESAPAPQPEVPASPQAAAAAAAAFSSLQNAPAASRQVAVA